MRRAACLVAPLQRAARAALLLGLAVCTGCSQGLGGFCTTDSDCQTPLRCSGRNGHRGVCTYPFDVGPVDSAAALEARPPADRGSDLRPEARPPDRAREASRPDIAVDLGAPAPDHQPADHNADRSRDAAGQ